MRLLSVNETSQVSGAGGAGSRAVSKIVDVAVEAIGKSFETKESLRSEAFRANGQIAKQFDKGSSGVGDFVASTFGSGADGDNGSNPWQFNF